MLYHGFLNITEATDYAKAHLIDQVMAGTSASPMMRFYKVDVPLFTVTFPHIETNDPELRAQERNNHFSQLAWMNSILQGDSVVLGVDSAVAMTTEDDIEYSQDVFLVFFANKMGAFVAPCPYVYSQDSGSIEWVERPIDQNTVMKTQPHIVSFLAGQFFFRHNLLPLDAYLAHLRDKGFEFEFHSHVSESNVAFTHEYLTPLK